MYFIFYLCDSVGFIIDYFGVNYGNVGFSIENFESFVVICDIICCEDDFLVFVECIFEVFGFEWIVV